MQNAAYHPLSWFPHQVSAGYTLHWPSGSKMRLIMSRVSLLLLHHSRYHLFSRLWRRYWWGGRIDWRRGVRGWLLLGYRILGIRFEYWKIEFLGNETTACKGKGYRFSMQVTPSQSSIHLFTTLIPFSHPFPLWISDLSTQDFPLLLERSSTTHATSCYPNNVLAAKTLAASTYPTPSLVTHNSSLFEVF